MKNKTKQNKIKNWQNKKMILIALVIFILLIFPKNSFSLITTDKEIYDIKESVNISISDVSLEGKEISIKFEENIYKYIGVIENLRFYPKDEGTYSIILSDESGKILESKEFDVKTPKKIRLNNDPLNLNDLNKSALKNSAKNSGFNLISIDNLTNIFLDSVNGSAIKDNIRDNIKNNPQIENLSNDNSIANKKSYALDESPKVSFQKFQKNIELKKINNLNIKIKKNGFDEKISYALREKNGEIELNLENNRKVKPGMYTITVTDAETGTVEEKTFAWGLISINTKKSIYHPNELAEVAMVVLDQGGFKRSGAYVELNITDPAGNNFSYSTKDTIVEISPGVYSTTFLIDKEGNYTLHAKTQSNDLNATIDSYVLSKSFYEFDILRDSPNVIDPWLGNFKTTINVVPYILANNYDLIEFVPSEFEITAPNAEITISNNNTTKILRWKNRAGTAYVSYFAKAPLVSPYLYQLGPAQIIYSENNVEKTFNEGRAWMLAADPTVNMRLNETRSASSTTVPTWMSMGAVDSTENNIAYTIAATTMVSFAIANSTAFGSNGIYIPSSTSMNFYGTFLSSTRAANIYVTWLAKKVTTGGGVTWICQAGNNNTGGAGLGSTNNVRVNISNSCTSPASGIRLNSTDILQMYVNVYNSRAGTSPATHYFDNLSSTASYLSFNAYKLGFLFANMTSPSVQQNIIQNDTFTITCAYNCTGGSCLNVNITAELNTSTNWTQIKNTGYLLILDGAETNPHTFSEVSGYTTTTFSIRANESTVGINKIRCAGYSDFSNYSVVNQTDSKYNGTLNSQETKINVTMKNYAPIPIGNFTDFGSNKTYPTIAGNNVWFNGNATDINQDLYKLIICSTNSTTGGSCTATTICQSDFVVSGNATNCSHSTSGESGVKEWFAFVCDNDPTPLCSQGDNANQTGRFGSPYYVDNAPTMTSINSNKNFAKQNDFILINTTGASDLESDSMQLLCGQTSGTYNLCQGSFNVGERNCSFNSPWLDNSVHTIYCALNDSWALSNEQTYEIISDNIAPIIYLNITNNSFISTSAVVLNFTIIDANPFNCSLWLNQTSGWSINQTKNELVSNELQTFNPISLTDGFYKWNVLCFDNATNTNWSAFGNYSFAVDTVGPNVTFMFPLNNSFVQTHEITFEYNVTELISNVSNCSLYIDDLINQTSPNYNQKVVNSTFYVTNLSNENHNWSLTCFDTTGNNKTSNIYFFSLFVDQFAPNISLISPEDGSWKNNAITIFKYNVTDNSNISNCSLYVNGIVNQTNGSIKNNAENNFTLMLNNNNYNWSVSCTDNTTYQNTAFTDNFTFYVDTIPPLGYFETENNSWFSVERPIVYFNITDNLADMVNYTFYVDGIADPNATDFQATGVGLSGHLTALSNGNHTIKIETTDLAGNSQNNTPFTFFVETTPPTIIINSPLTNTYTNSTTPKINFTLNDDFSPYINYTLFIDGTLNGQFGNSTNGSTIALTIDPALTEGAKIIKVEGKNKAGLSQNSSALNLIVDLTPPTIALKYPIDFYNSSSANVMLNFSATDNLATSLLCNLTLDGTIIFSNINALLNQEINMTATSLSEGNHTWNVTCMDNATIKNTSSTWRFLVDTIAPTVNLISPQNNTDWSSAKTVVFKYNVTDANFVDACYLYLNGILSNTTNSPLKNTTINFTTNLGNGQYNWSINCTDTSRNFGKSEIYNLTVSVLTDDVPPTINIYFPQELYWNSTGNVSFNFSANDASNISNCTLIIDGIKNQTENNITNNVYTYFNVSDLSEGTHNWFLNCTDKSPQNNTASTSARTLKIDKTLPGIQINFPSQRFNTSSNLVQLNYTATDNMADKLLCNITFDNANIFSEISTPNQIVNYTKTSMSEGVHYWNVTCVDNATNKNTSATQTIVADYSGPIVNLETPANNSRLTQSNYNVTYYFNASDILTATSNCSIIIDDIIIQTKYNIDSDTKQNFTVAMNAGLHNWSVNCTDIVKNVGASAKFNISLAEILFVNPILPADYTEVDRDQKNQNVNDNSTLLVYLTNNNGGTLVTFKANLTMPILSGKKNIVLGQANTNSTGHARLVWNGTDANSAKMFAGNYTWWAEATNYVGNGTNVIYLFGSLNISYRYESNDPDSAYGENASAKFDMFLKSYGPESDAQINGTYYANMNLTFTKPNSLTSVITMVDPDIEENQIMRQGVLSTSSKNQSINHSLTNTLFAFDWTNAIQKVGNKRFEKGVIAINPKKEYYTNKEIVEIKIAVLDKLGYLSERNDLEIVLEKEQQNNSSKNLSLSKNSFSKKKEIVLTQVFTKKDLLPTNRIGVYDLKLNFSKFSDLNSNDSIGTYAIRGYLEKTFISENKIKIVEEKNKGIEILRNTPIVIDPLKDLLRTNLVVLNLEKQNITEIDLTETIPAEFEIINKPNNQNNDDPSYNDNEEVNQNIKNLQILQESSDAKNTSTKTIIWPKLKDKFEVNYYAKVPNKSPYLYELGKSKILAPINPVNQNNSHTNISRTIIHEEARPWILAVDPTQVFQLNETSTASYTSSSTINLSAYDTTQNNITFTIGTTLYRMVNATSSAFGSNGLFIPNGNAINFYGTFRSSRTTSYVTWVAQEKEGTVFRTICQAGNNNTLGTRISVAATMRNLSDSCTSPGYRLNATDQFNVAVNVYTTQSNVVTHYWDNWSTTQSYVSFSAYKLGFLFVNMTSPSIQQNIKQNDTFTLTCAYNCTGGSCLNVNLFAEINTSKNWTPINFTGELVLLDSGETNPQTFSEINSYTTATFSLRANNSAVGINKVRCAGYSDYSNYSVVNQTDSKYNGTLNSQETKINVTMKNYAPIPIGNFTDFGSNKTYPTIAGNNVWFNGNATEVNQDLYKLIICSTNSTTGGSCTATTICQSNFIGGGNVTNCSHSTSGESGVKEWFAFVCDNDPTPLCSQGDNANQTGRFGSPYYVDNAPTMTSINSNLDFLRLNDLVEITSEGATDTEGDLLQLVCGQTSGNYDLCAGTFDNGERNCVFNSPWADNILHTIHCALNDSYTLSNEKTYSVISDNLLPIIYLNISDNHFFKTTNVGLNFTAIETNPINCSLYSNFSGNWQINQTDISIISNTLQSFNVIPLADGYYSWNVFCIDNATNTNWADSNYSFTVDTVAPTINLVSPDPDFLWGASLQVTFQYSVDDITSSITNCSLILNKKINETIQNVPKGSVQQFVTTLYEGQFNWSINCTDYALNTNSSTTRNLTLNVSGDYAPPTVSLDSPQANYWNTTNKFTFYYTPNDNIGLASCSLIIDGAVTQTNNSVVKGAQSKFNVSEISYGEHAWTINCSDYQQNSVQPQARFFGADNVAPTINLENPANAFKWTTSDKVTFEYNVSDLYSGPQTCILIVNDTTRAIDGSIIQNNNQQLLITLTNGEYSWGINCTDYAGNMNFSERRDLIVNSSMKHWLGYYNFSNDPEGIWNISATTYTRWFYQSNESTRKITYDVFGPNITIISPLNNSKIIGTNVTFLFNVSDTYSNITNCSITIDGVYFNTTWNITQNITQNFSTQLGYLNHTYFLECYDSVGNKKNSGLITFNITYIDLAIFSTGMNFSKQNPIEGENVTVFATIFNLGNQNAGAFISQFYEGDPLNGGTKIGGDVIITGLNAGLNTTINSTWLAHQGDYQIYLLVDTPLSINGSIGELNEENNKNFSIISVPIWQYYFGNISGVLLLDRNDSTTIESWNITKITGNIYVVDADSNVNWMSLKALGMNISNISRPNDFVLADIALNTTNKTDSINLTYTTNGVPTSTRIFSVFGLNVTNVSYIDSTPSSSFVTGIMWDQSQAASYNGSQDLIFATEINRKSQGGFGVYDYELRVPANLKKLKPGSDAVAFYTDIQ